VQLLIDEGADMAAKNDQGMTALDFSRLGESRASFDVLTAELNALNEPEKPATSRSALKLKPTTSIAPVEVKESAEPATPTVNKQSFKTRFD
jgi:ankyrin repeat protein